MICSAVTSSLAASLALPWFAPPKILSLKVATFKGGAGHTRARCKQKKLLRHISHRHNADAEALCEKPPPK
jgi:hypothetical protein